MSKLIFIFTTFLSFAPALATDFRSEWSFKFENGNTAYFIPSEGVWLKKADSTECIQIVKYEIAHFESTEMDYADDGFEVTDDKMTSVIHHSTGGTVTFFSSTSEGLFALSQNGKTNTIVYKQTVEKLQQTIPFIALPKITSKSGKSWRAFVALMPNGEQEMFPLFKILSSDLKAIQFTFSNQPVRTWLNYKLDIVNTSEGKEIIRSGVQSKSRGSELKSFFVEDEPRGAGPSSHRYQQYVESATLPIRDVRWKHFYILDSNEIFQSEKRLKEAMKFLSTLKQLPVRVDPALIPALLQETDRWILNGQLAGIVKYQPLADDASGEDLDQWIKEIREFKKINAPHPYLLLMQRGSKWSAVLRPAGLGGKDLDADLEACNLIFEQP